MGALSAVLPVFSATPTKEVERIRLPRANDEDEAFAAFMNALYAARGTFNEGHWDAFVKERGIDPGLLQSTMKSFEKTGFQTQVAAWRETNAPTLSLLRLDSPRPLFVYTDTQWQHVKTACDNLEAARKTWLGAGKQTLDQFCGVVTKRVDELHSVPADVLQSAISENFATRRVAKFLIGDKLDEEQQETLAPVVGEINAIERLVDKRGFSVYSEEVTHLLKAVAAKIAALPDVEYEAMLRLVALESTAFEGRPVRVASIYSRMLFFIEATPKSKWPRTEELVPLLPLFLDHKNNRRTEWGVLAPDAAFLPRGPVRAQAERFQQKLSEDSTQSIGYLASICEL